MKLALVSLIRYLVMADSRFVGNKPLIFDCDFNLCHGNLNFVRDNLLILLYLPVKFD